MKSVQRLATFAMTALTCLAPESFAADVPRSTDGSDPKTWDRKRDGVLAAPENHKVIYEDAVVRIQSVTVPAGTEEKLHLHPYYSVLVFDALVPLEDRDASGKALKDFVVVDGISRPGVPVPWVVVQPPQALHSVKNAGKSAGHLIRVEFKQGTVPAIARPAWLASGQMPLSTDGSDPKTWPEKCDGVIAAGDVHKVIFENELIRVQSVTVAPMTEEPYHCHPYASVIVVDRAPATFVDRDRTGKVVGGRTAAAFGPSVTLQPPQTIHSVKNSDASTDIHLTRIEFKKGFPQ